MKNLRAFLFFLAAIGIAKFAVAAEPAPEGLVGHFKDGAHIIARELNLGGIRHATIRAGCLNTQGYKL